MSRSSEDYKHLAGVFTSWWRELRSLDDASGKPKRRNGVEIGPDRASLAQLRRINVTPGSDGIPAVDIGGALGVAAFRDLVSHVTALPLHSKHVRRWLANDTRTLEPFAIAAAALARIQDDSSSNEKDVRGATARLLGAGESRPLAEVRFKRLMRCKNDWPDLMLQARRIAAILEKKAPVGDLGASIVLWNADPTIVRDWAFQYYQEDFKPAPTAPVASSPSSPSTP